jgi:hypothetical protein
LKTLYLPDTKSSTLLLLFTEIIALG